MSEVLEQDCSNQSSSPNSKECPKGFTDYFEVEYDGSGNPIGANFNGEGFIPCLDLDGGFDCYEIGANAFYFLKQRALSAYSSVSNASNNPIGNFLNNFL